MTEKEKVLKEIKKKGSMDEKIKQMGLYYTLQSLLGAPVTWIWLCGSRGRGKSYATVDYILNQQKKYGPENVKYYHIRISDLSIKALLANNAQKAIEPALRRKYGLDISVKSNIIYSGGKPICEMYALVSAAKVAKGAALFDQDFIDKAPIDPKTGKKVKRKIYIVWDEFQMAEGVEMKTVGNPTDQFRIYIESLLRDQEQTKGNDPAVRILCCANSVSEAAGAMAQLMNFIPTKPGRYWLTRKHAVIDNIPNSEAYIEKRKKSIGADIMDMDNDANYTNVVKRDLESLIPKGTRLRKVTNIIKFTKEPSTWFTVWDGNIVKRWKNQTFSPGIVIPMRRYLNEVYDLDAVNNVFALYDSRAFKYADLVSQAFFAEQLKLLKKQ